MPANFDYTNAVREVCQDICLRLPVFSHIRFSQVGFSFSQTRNNRVYGTYASLTPLRFEGGKRDCRRGGVCWRVPTVSDQQGHHLLYVLTIFMPRFANLTLQQKVETLVHELYHISEYFNGDVRRFPGRCYAHGDKKTRYDEIAQRLAQEWLRRDPAPELWAFLKYNFRDVVARYGAVTGVVIRIPSPVRVPGPGTRK